MNLGLKGLNLSDNCVNITSNKKKYKTEIKLESPKQSNL